MMTRTGLPATLLALITLFTLTLPAQAALLGRLPATPGGTDYQAYYDDVADLTWMQDANAAGTTMTWSDAVNWAATVSINGIGGWRIPATLQPDPSCDDQLDGGVHGPQGYRHNCTGSEMGNLFYNVLGGSAFTDIALSHNSNYDLFDNIQSDIYWSGTVYAPSPTSAWSFRFLSGDQRSFAQSVDVFYAWGVYDGDVGASVVPVPAAAWLFSSGLLALLGMRRRQR